MMEDLPGCDSDDEDVTAGAYFIDLVQRAGEVGDILEALKGGPFVRAWMHRRTLKHSRLLTDDDIHLAFDTNVVDWDDYHLQYLATLCKHQAPNKDAAHTKSHEQISTASALQDKLKRQMPDHIADDKHKVEEWMGIIVFSALEYDKQVGLNIRNGSGATLPTRVRDILAVQWSPVDGEHEQTIYYIAGAVMRMIGGLSERSGEKYVAALKELKTRAETTKEDAKEGPLPSGKVEEREKYQLCYANGDFYAIMCKIESVFHELLSEGNVALYGACIIRDIAHALSDEEFGIGALLLGYSGEVISEVVRRIVRSYGRLRGKDFVRKCNARTGTKSHETTRATLGVAAGAASKRAKQKGKGKGKAGRDTNSSNSGNGGSGGDGGGNDGGGETSEEEESPRWKFLMKQQKDFLVTACKNRGLRYSGTKKVLTGRIVQREKEEAEERKKKREAKEAAEAANPTPKPPREVDFDEEYGEYLQGLLADVETHEEESLQYFQEIYKTL